MNLLLSRVQLFCIPMGHSLAGSSVHGISQARILEWVAILFSRESSWPVDQTRFCCIDRWALYYWAIIRRNLYLVVVQLLSCVWLFATTRAATCQASLSITIFWSFLKLMSIKSVIPLTILSSINPLFSCFQSFPGSFPMSQLFTSGDQSIGASVSASVLPMNIQHWFPLRLVGSPYSPRDSQESSPTPTPTQFKSISSSVLSLLYGPSLTSIHD